MGEKIDFDELAGDLLMWPGALLLVLGPIAVIGYQVLNWLKTGDWPPLMFLDAVHFFGIETTGLVNPSSWQGLAEVVLWILGLPLSLMLPVLGGLWLIGASNILRGHQETDRL